MQNKPIPVSNEPAEALLTRFKKFYQNFSMDTITLLNEIYTQDIEFVDPVLSIHGSLGLKNYLRKKARNLQYFRIRYLESLVGEDCAYLSWQMEYAHGAIGKGELISLRGMSRLHFTSKVYYQENCYDLGGMVYEHIPVLGRLTGSLKQRLSS